MKLISHRGNINGRIESLENEPTYIDLAISKGYDVEIDIWYKDGVLWLGHDKPDYGIDLQWLINRITKLWVHCKNVAAFVYFSNCEQSFNYFWHEEDTLTLTSKKYIWAYPGKQPIKDSISVLPEIYNDVIDECLGVCSDFIQKYKV
jgi:hypothetical protein